MENAGHAVTLNQIKLKQFFKRFFCERTGYAIFVCFSFFYLKRSFLCYGKMYEKFIRSQYVKHLHFLNDFKGSGYLYRIQR